MSLGLNFGCRHHHHHHRHHHHHHRQSFENFANSRFDNQNFIGHICNFVGETVTIFTTSGGASGCGFTGILLSVNCDFCRVSTHIGTAPANPLSEHICPTIQGFDEGMDDLGAPLGTDNRCGQCGRERGYDRFRGVGSVVDIPLNRIAAFCHNAV